VTTGQFSSGAREATPRKCCEPGPFYFAWGWFRDFVQALRWTAHSVSKTRVNTLAEALRFSPILLSCGAFASSNAIVQKWERGIEQIREVARSVGFVSTSGAHKSPSRRTSVQASGTTPTLAFHVEIMRG
jgi:hypothetical protein